MFNLFKNQNVQPVQNVPNQKIIEKAPPLVQKEIQPVVQKKQFSAQLIQKEIQPVVQKKPFPAQLIQKEIQPPIQKRAYIAQNLVQKEAHPIIRIQEKINDEKDDDEDEEEKDENEMINKKCSLDEHKDIDALFYCQECKVKMCKKCEKVHSGLLKKHHIYSLDKDINEIFTGLCTNKDHSLELEIYCKNHNKLCCAACISKIKIKGKSQHKNCEVYHISKIKDSKKENLEKNIQHLEELSDKLESLIKELKNIYDKINESKEKLKVDIQKNFTKIRAELNNREDKLYEEIDKIFEKLFFDEHLIKECEQLPKLVKTCLEKGKIQENEWKEENKLSELVNHCIKIENSITKIDSLYNKLQEYNSNKEVEINFEPKNEDIENNLINEIKNYGKINVIPNRKKDDFNINKINI